MHVGYTRLEHRELQRTVGTAQTDKVERTRRDDPELSILSHFTWIVENEDRGPPVSESP